MDQPVKEPWPTCTFPGCVKPAHTKSSGLCMTHYQAARRKVIKQVAKTPEPGPVALMVDLPPDLTQKLTKARTQADWQEIAGAVQPIMEAILSGEAKANPAQVSLLKEILTRAYGRAGDAIEQKITPGVIVLPALSNGQTMMLCPQCGFDISSKLEGLQAKVMTAISTAVKGE